MKIECDWTRNDLKKHLKQKRVIPNLVFFVLAVCVFGLIIQYGFHNNNFEKKILLVGFVVYLVFLIALLWGITKLYVILKLRQNDKKTGKAYGKYLIEVDEKKIASQIGDIKISYRWEDVSSYKIRKKYFFLRTKKDKIGLCFRREVLGNDYDKLLSYVKKCLTN